MKKFILLIILLLLPLFCCAQEPLSVETNNKEYAISPEGTLNGLELIITNEGITKWANEAYIVLHGMPAGSSWFDLAFEGTTYRIKNFSYFYKDLDISPESMKCRLIIYGPECKPHIEGYLLDRRSKIVWKFSPIMFGQTSERIDWSLIKDPEATIEVLASYSFPYVARQDFLDNRAKGRGMVSTGTFVSKCPKKWFYNLSKRKKEETDLPAQ